MEMNDDFVADGSGLELAWDPISYLVFSEWNVWIKDLLLKVYSMILI
jgi:hypothetical protein